MPEVHDELTRERRNDVLVLRLNRPEARNAITSGMLGGLADAVDESERDPDIRVLVLTGAGDRAFCAGVDLGALAASPGDGGDSVPEPFLRLLAGTVTVPVIAAVNGAAVGLGCELVLGCDIVVASSRASFGLPEVRRGLVAGSGVLHIARRLPLGVALELGLTGERIDAARAHQLGFVNAVTAPAELLDVAMRYADTIAANAPLSLTATKELIRRAAGGDPDADDRRRHWQERIFASEDATEGAMAFIEKRAPVWRGR